MAAVSTLENLSDEVLMIIFRYLGDVYSIFRTFSGLNLRFNRILVDRRLHLLTDLLELNVDRIKLDDYYHSSFFTVLSERLCFLKENNNDNELQQCFRMLLSFHIEEKYHQSETEFLSNRVQFESIRTQLSDEEIHLRDETVKKSFNKLHSNLKTIENIQQLEVVVRAGAHLDCSNNELGEFNLTQAINQYLLGYANIIWNFGRHTLKSLLSLFKSLIISNPNLVYNRDYVGNGGAPLYFFLVYSTFRLVDFYSCSSIMTMSIRRFQVIIELLLFTIQCLKSISNDNVWIYHCISDSLQWATSLESNTEQQKIIIGTNQLEILKILFNELIQREISWNSDYDYQFLNGFRNLVKMNRLDIILLIFRQNTFLEEFFQQSDHYRKVMNMMTANQAVRNLFKQLLVDNSTCLHLRTRKLLYILLEKKECKLIKKLLQLDETLIHQVDDDGNDPLLYVCLNVNGCRHRVVQHLIDIGSDLQRRNVNGEDFFQILNQIRNRKLKEKLIEHEII